jgi:glycosyltransferase involved in cell wall biosynthesis
VRRIRPAVAFLEQEPFALSALQWGRALASLRIPFGVQMDENLDRVMPPAVRTARRWVLEHAAFVAARSPDAAALAERWGATGEVAVVPHAVPAWGPEPASPARDTFTIGFAGRLVEEKGILDLTAAVCQMRAAKRLLVVGSGPLAPRLRELQREGAPIELREGVSHGEMPAIFAEMDVLVLPSRTTPDWAEQFGRVIVEALWSGVPVVGSDSGAIPWVLETTGGGKVFPEGDVGRLAAALDELASDPAVRRRLAETGGRVARERFGRAAAASALEQVLHKLGHEQPRSHEHPG